jgi:hexosaminidase
MPLLALLLLPLALSAAEPSLIPRPVALVEGLGAPVAVVAGTAVHVAGAGLEGLVAQLIDRVARDCSLRLTPAPGRDGPGIALLLDPASAVSGPDWAAAEGYSLVSGDGRIAITARSPHGLFNGVQTLLQMMTNVGAGGWHVPAVTVTDSPRFRWRGLMLDCGRHFFSVAEVCRFIDEMASYKFNTFHWHLTEDQGWRIAVSAYPKLTSVGAWRTESPRMGDAKTGDGTRYGGFYSTDDIRAVVAYAQERFITIIPEFEMPGHSSAAIASYPELGNTDIPGWTTPPVATRWGVIPHTLAPREETFRFINTVFDEVLPLFPGAYVHIGGDESPKTEWQASPFAQQVMKDHQLPDEHHLQSWFIQRVEQLLTVHGKRLIGWDEIQEGGLSPTATMMVWRKWSWATAALEHGNDIVMAPTSHTYFDYNPGPNPGGPTFQTINGQNPRGALAVEKVYSLEPIPEGTPPERWSQVLGCQGQLWSEYIWSLPKLEYMAWPRACALSEIAWSPRDGKDWASFSRRLAGQAPFLERMRINYRQEDGTPARPQESMALTPHDAPSH